MKNNRNTFFGILFIIFGIIYLGGLLNFWPFINLWSTGWIILSFILGVYLIISKNYIGGFVFFGFSLSRIIDYLPYPYSSMFHLSTWNIIVIALLFGIGFQIIFKGSFRSRNYRKYDKYKKYDTNYTCSNTTSTCDENVIDGESETIYEESTKEDFRDNGMNELFVTANFNEVNRYVTSNGFRGGEVNCSFGSVTIHLTQADLDVNGAHLNLNCSFGAIKVYVPRTWAVNNKIQSTLFSQINDDRLDVYDDSLPNLTLTGNVNFGEIKIMYV